MGSWNWISLTTDYGQAEGFVAACRGVIARLAPQVQVMDVTHLIPPQDVRRGAEVLAQTVTWLPPAVHVAVVDPGVGTSRRGVCVSAGPATLVGPDNGLLPPAADALGGIESVHALEDPRFWLPSVSSTFHGRDIFAPVAAHLALGVDPAELGPLIPADDLVRLPPPRITVGPGRIEADVLTIDSFGNVQLAATRADLAVAGFDPGSPVSLRVRQSARRALLGQTFGDVGFGELVVYVDSAERVAIAMNGGSASATFRVREGDRVVLARTR
jgi:S-adenosyl-L-methionine hydrolase (adenosine-forming)